VLVDALNLQSLLASFLGEMELSRLASEEAIQVSRLIDYPYGLYLLSFLSTDLSIFSLMNSIDYMSLITLDISNWIRLHD